MAQVLSPLNFPWFYWHLSSRRRVHNAINRGGGSKNTTAHKTVFGLLRLKIIQLENGQSAAKTQCSRSWTVNDQQIGVSTHLRDTLGLADHDFGPTCYSHALAGHESQREVALARFGTFMYHYIWWPRAVAYF